MSQRRREQTLTGTVVRIVDYAESDRIVELVTAEEGRVALLARGGRASKKRFAGALDLFVGLRAQVIAGPKLWSLHGADIATARAGIRLSLARIGRASLLCECAMLLTPEHQEAAAVAAALADGLDALDRGELASAVAAYPRMLTAAGILPDLSSCARCGRRGAMARLDLGSGGALCRDCAPGALALGEPAWRVLAGAPCTDERVAAEVESAAADLVEAHAGRALRSRRVLLRSASGLVAARGD